MVRTIRLMSLTFALPGCWGAPGDPGPSAAASTPPSAPAEVTQRVALGRLKVIDETPKAQRLVPVAQERLEAILRAALARAGLIEPGDAAKPWVLSARAPVIYGVGGETGALRTDLGSGTTAARWHIDLDLQDPLAAGSMEFAYDGRDDGPFSGDARALEASLTAHLEAALRDLTNSTRARLDVVTRPPAGLIAALSEPSAEGRLWALERLSGLRAREAVPALIRLLKLEGDAHRPLRLRTIGALAEIGDPGAVDALIGIADTKDREMLHALVETLATLGGPAVEPFLSVLAEHDAPDVRELVSRARERLAARRPRP